MYFFHTSSTKWSLMHRLLRRTDPSWILWWGNLLICSTHSAPSWKVFTVVSTLADTWEQRWKMLIQLSLLMRRWSVCLHVHLVYIVYSVSCLCGKCLCVLYLMTLNTHFITCVYSNHNAKLSPVQVLYLYSTVGYMLITTVLVHCIVCLVVLHCYLYRGRLYSKSCGCSSRQGTIGEVNPVYCWQTGECTCTFVSVLNPAHNTVNVYCVFQVYLLVACLFVLVRHIIYYNTKSVSVFLERNGWRSEEGPSDRGVTIEESSFCTFLKQLQHILLLTFHVSYPKWL